VVLGAIIVSLYYFINGNKLVEKLITAICFVILNIFLFINGCFAVEFALFAAELALFIFYWIKNKKFPLWIFIAFMVTFVASFFRNHGYSSSNTVFIFELLGRIDIKLGTNFMGVAIDFVDSFSYFIRDLFIGDIANIDKDKRIIAALKEDPTLADSRTQVMKNALNAIRTNAGTFLFGNGIGFSDAVRFMRVHNVFVLLWLEFGFVFMLVFIALFVSLLVMFIKSKNKSKHIVYLVMVFAYLLSYYFGMMDFSFPFFLMLLAILYKNLKEDVKENKDKKEN
jgi:ABC-type multidrug transport system fused ATPase/permease subunit